MALILGIESSCDETAASVVQDGCFVHSSIVASQEELHVEYGGVVPEIASRAHVERILPVIEQALKVANIDAAQLDGIAVGNRPGLIGALLVGLAAAKSMAWSLQIPFIAVDHVLAHLYAPMLVTNKEQKGEQIQYPALGLIVSGGHTAILLLTSPTEASCISKTVDDAAGEAFDKAASILELGWPGGPLIDKAASKGAPVHSLPRPKKKDDSQFNYSFSGLKTALLYGVRGIPKKIDGTVTYTRNASDLSLQEQQDWAASFQAAAVDSILFGIEKALDALNVQCIVAGGGVIANTAIRQRLKDVAAAHQLPLHLPDNDFCIDNAAMIAGLGDALLNEGKTDSMETTASPRGIAS